MDPERKTQCAPVQTTASGLSEIFLHRLYRLAKHGEDGTGPQPGLYRLWLGLDECEVLLLGFPRF